MICEILVGRNTPSKEETFAEIFGPLRQQAMCHAQIWPKNVVF